MSSDRKPELRRSVTPWGSFSWGYSDVGADIFVGLGLVRGAAAGASNVAGADSEGAVGRAEAPQGESKS